MDMLQKDIQKGKLYTIKHHDGQIYTVRVDGIGSRRTFGSRDGVSKTLVRYLCTKLATGNSIIVKSAAKFREEVAQ
jgi:hypothetical protein